MDEEIKILADDELERTFTDDSFKMYMKDIRKYPILSIEEQKELGRCYRENNDLKARELLINCNLRLVVNIAHRYKFRIKSFQVLDVIQEGNAGLIRAVETYEPEKGAFTTYAVPWIIQGITRGLNNKNDEIRKPSYVIYATSKYISLVDEYKRQGLQMPSDDVICETLNITKRTLQAIRTSLSENLVSLNQTIDDNHQSELEDFISIENYDYDNVLNKIVDDNLLIVLKEVLNPVQYFIIYHRVLNDEQKSLDEIGTYLNITKERVRQIENVILKKLKPYMVENSIVFTKTLNRIKQREGYKFNFLKRTPLTPTHIISYMYLKSDLTDLERQFYELNVLGKYKYRNEEYASILGITLEELKQIMATLKVKINHKFSDASAFKNFQEQMFEKYGSSIFDIDFNKVEKVIDYRSLQEKYSSLSLEDILGYLKDINYILTSDEENLLKKYFGVCTSGNLTEREIEKEVNILMFGYKKNSKQVPLKNLYQKYIKIKSKFTEEQQLYLETYFFGKKACSLFDSKYPNSILLRNCQWLIDKLERNYYHINEYFENHFTKENWLEVKEKYGEQFSNEKILYLDLYYGVKGKIYSIPKISEMFHMDYNKMHDLIRDARNLAINLFSTINRKIEIDRKKYIPYIENLHYDFTKETRYILKLFIIDGKSYSEINKITGLNVARISNIITDGIRRIDNFRFGIIDCFIISEDELNDFFKYYGGKITPVEKEIIRLKHLNHMENKDIALRVGKTLPEINRYVRRFNVFYENYMIKDVVLTNNDIATEISKHKSESVWPEEYKRFASFYFGIKCKYNPDGVTLKSEALRKKLGYSNNVYNKTYTNMLKLLKSCKIGIAKPENNYISREKLDELLDDVHLPISEKERKIICYLFELKGYPYKTIDELVTIFEDNKGSIKRRYQRAIASIYKYLYGEIEGCIHYETDIVPILKYFGISDRMKIEDFYKNGLTYEKMAIKYGMTFDNIVNIMNRIKTTIYDLMNNPDAKKFDFDYYLEAINNPDLPFTGDLTLAIQIFNLVFGMDGEERLSIPAIKEKLQLDFRTTTLNSTIYSLMLSVCKLKDGIKKDKTFSFEQVYSYFTNNYDSIPICRRKIYQKYINRFKSVKNIKGVGVKLSSEIIYDLIIANNSNVFELKTTNREKVIELINKYGKELNRKVRSELMGRFDIRERSYMSGKEINHIFKLLYTLDTRRKALNCPSLTLKKI